MRKLIRRLLYLVQGNRHVRELAEEMDFHRSMLARRSHERRFGNATLAIEDSRGVWVPEPFDALWRDLRYGLRMLRREPTFTFAAIATLAIGVLTLTTVFTIVDAQLWRPLPFPQPASLIAVAGNGPGAVNTTEDVSGPDFFAWRSEAGLAAYAAVGAEDVHTLRRETSESVLTMMVSGNFFDVLRWRPVIGRGFDESDEHGARLAILSYEAWTTRFNSDRAIVGRSIVLDRDSYTVIGIAPSSGLQMFQEPDIYLPLDRNAADVSSWTTRTLDVIGRLSRSATLAQANSELQAIEGRNAVLAPDAHRGHHVHLDALRKDYYRIAVDWRSLYFVLAAAVLVLLLACGNVAHLLLARALRRRQEFAIRGALGGGRRALARQLAIEGALLAAPGVVLGVLCSSWSLAVVGTRIPAEYLHRGGPLTLDSRTAILAAAVAVVATMTLALAPLLFARRIDLNPMLGAAARTAGGAPQQARLRYSLVIAQMTMTLVLLTAAGLLIVSFVKLTRAPLGFDASDRLSVPFRIDDQRGDGFVRAFADRVRAAARAVPGIGAAAVASSSPLGGGALAKFVVSDQPGPSASHEPWALFRSVSPDYFQTLGIHLLAGRGFTPADTPGAPRVAIVNDRLARRFFPDGRAIGRRLTLLPGRSRWTNRPGEVEIVGIAPYVHELGMNEAEWDDIYVPFAQAPPSSFDLLIHAAIAPESVAVPLTRAMASSDPSVVTGAMTTFDQRIDSALGNDRFNMQLIVSFAAVAILLAFIGIYGTIAYTMEERTREFGVRLALGASPSQIMRGALWQAARLGFAGAALGACSAMAAARLLGNALYLVPQMHGGVLYGVSSSDPRVLSVAIVALIAVAVLAGIVPARHAMSVDPSVTLRE